MAHTSDDNTAQAWFEKGLAEGRRQASYEAGLATGRSSPQPDAPLAVRGAHSATMAALAQASVPAGHQGTSGLTTAATAAPVPETAVVGEVIDWDAIATKSNAKDKLHRNEATGIWGRK